jgi:hypothetical protein
MSDVPSVWVAKKALMARALICALALGVALGGIPNARAQGKKGIADALFDEGKTLLQAGDWPGACAKFQASFDADAAVSTAVKIARCREHEGKLARAVAEYRRALELNQTLPQTTERKKELEALIVGDLAQLEARVPRLRFEITPRPSGLEVTVNGAPVPEASLAAPFAIDPGEPEVVVRAPGYREERLKPRVPEGVTHELVLTLVPNPDGAGPAPAPAPKSLVAAPVAPPRGASAAPGPNDVPESDAGSGQKTFGAVVGGAGVVALGVAGYFGIKTLVLVDAARPRCPENECDGRGYRMMNDAENAQTTGLVVGGAGALLLGAGIALYLSAPTDARPNQTSLSARLGPTGAHLEGTF